MAISAHSVSRLAGSEGDFMGRWDSGIYDSDATLDAFGWLVSDYIKRELAYKFLPINILKTGRWLNEILGILETMVILCENKVGSWTYLWEYDDVIQTWEQAFLDIWDSDWQRPQELSQVSYADYRKSNRHICKDLFKYIFEMVDYWGDDVSDTKPISKQQLPLLSLDSLFPADLLEHLTESIVYTISDENEYRDNSDAEHIWVAVDVMGIICEAYQINFSYAHHIEKWEKQSNELLNMSDWQPKTPEEKELDNHLRKNVDKIWARLKKYSKKQ